MLNIYGSPFSSPTNKIIYTANYLKLPTTFHHIELSTGEHRQPAFLEINPLGKIPAIEDDGFSLGESNAIIRYLALKHASELYPNDLKTRSVIDQWMDYAAQHVAMATSKIMWNTYFYQFAKTARDERSFEDGHRFIGLYLPVIENQLQDNAFIAGTKMTLADIAMLVALDTCELCELDLSTFPHITAWRKKLMNEKFYTDCHESYTATFTESLKKRKQEAI